MENSELPEWKKRALSDPNLHPKAVEVIIHGPKKLTDAWMLQALKFKYSK